MSRNGFGAQVRQRFGRRAADYEGEARLQQAMAWRLARCSAGLPLPQGPCADLGAGTGLLSRALLRHHPQLRLRPPLQLDLCPDLLARNPLAGGSDGAEASAPGAGRTTAAAANGHGEGRSDGVIWDLNSGLPRGLDNAALLASSFALQWLENPASSLSLWCRSLQPGGWLLLAVPTACSFPQWREASDRAGVPCTALPLPQAEALQQAAEAGGLQVRQSQRLRFSRPRQGGLATLRHLQRLGASASRRGPLTPAQLRRLLGHWPEHSPLTWEVLLLIGQRRP